MSSDMNLKLVLKAYDGMSDVVKSACTQSDMAFDKTNKHLEDMSGKFDRVGKGAVVFGGTLTALSAVNAKMAGDFEQGINNVSTLIDTNVEDFDDMKKSVLNMAKDSPKAISDLTDGLYSIRSAGITAAQQFNVLKGSEKLAVSGLATTAEAVDVTTSAINAFNLKAKESDKIYDTFFKAVKYGKTNISEFAQGFGQTAPIIAAAGIQLDEYSASVAAMRTAGVKASIAHTQIKAAIASLSRGSKEQIAVFNQMGAKSFNDLVQKSGGMVNAFNRINKAVNGNQSKLIQLVGSTEAYNAILSLTGATNAKYTEALNDMRNGANSLDEAYAKQMNGINNQTARLRNNIQALSIRFGTGLLPIVTAAAGGLSSLVGIIDKMPDGLVNFISITTAGIGGVSLFAGTALVAAGSILKSLTTLRIALRGTSIAAWALNISMKAVLGWGAVILAAGAAAVYAYNHFEGFRNVCQGLWATIQAGGAWLAVFGRALIKCGAFVWNLISPVAKFAGTILSWTTPIELVIRAITKLVSAMGGLRGIGDKLNTWAGNSKEAADNINNKLRLKPDGSHANGLDTVPFDGYIAQTHKGEAILNQKEADVWRDIKSHNTSLFNTSENSNISLQYSPDITLSNGLSSVKDEFKELLYLHKEELLRMLLSLLERRQARAY